MFDAAEFETNDVGTRVRYLQTVRESEESKRSHLDSLIQHYRYKFMDAKNKKSEFAKECEERILKNLEDLEKQRQEKIDSINAVKEEMFKLIDELPEFNKNTLEVATILASIIKKLRN